MSIRKLAQRLLRLFLELNKRGTTIVIATRAIGLMDRYEVVVQTMSEIEDSKASGWRFRIEEISSYRWAISKPRW